MENSFDKFWNLYDKKTSREKAEKKWNTLSAKNQELIMLHIPKYKLKQPDRQFRKDPCTYMNNQSWLDEVYNEKEDKTLYTEPKETKVSDYEAKPYDPDKALQHMKDKLRKNFENGTPIRDMGGIYSNRLKFAVPIEVVFGIERKEKEEKERKRNRFEPQYVGSFDSNIRDRKLNWFLDKCREAQRDLSLEI